MVLNLPTTCCCRPMAALCCSGDDRFIAGGPTRSWVTLEGINQPHAPVHIPFFDRHTFEVHYSECVIACSVSVNLTPAPGWYDAHFRSKCVWETFGFGVFSFKLFFLYCSSTMCGSQHLSASFYMWLQVWFGVLNVPNAVFDTRNVMKMPWTFNNKKIWLSELWHDGYCMSLWYLKSYGSQRSNHSHSPYTFLSGLHCPIKKIWGLETAGVERGGRDAVWVRERESFVWERIGTSYCVQFVSCRFLPVKSDDINEKMKLRANAQHQLDVGSAVCVSVW